MGSDGDSCMTPTITRLIRINTELFYDFISRYIHVEICAVTFVQLIITTYEAVCSCDVIVRDSSQQLA